MQVYPHRLAMQKDLCGFAVQLRIGICNALCDILSQTVVAVLDMEGFLCTRTEGNEALSL